MKGAGGKGEGSVPKGCNSSEVGFLHQSSSFIDLVSVWKEKDGDKEECCGRGPSQECAAFLLWGLLGYAPDTGERQRGRSQESLSHWKGRMYQSTSMVNLDGQTLVARSRLITLLECTATALLFQGSYQTTAHQPLI